MFPSTPCHTLDPPFLISIFSSRKSYHVCSLPLPSKKRRRRRRNFSKNYQLALFQSSVPLLDIFFSSHGSFQGSSQALLQPSLLPRYAWGGEGHSCGNTDVDCFPSMPIPLTMLTFSAYSTTTTAHLLRPL